MAILGLWCKKHAGIRIIRRFKGHAVSETCTVVFVWHAELLQASFACNNYYCTEI